MQYLKLLILVIFSTSCTIIRYHEPKTLLTPHAGIMNSDFTTKEDVFNKFGAADKKDKLNNTEIWTYNLSSETYSEIKGQEYRLNRRNEKSFNGQVLSSSNGVMNMTGTSRNIQNYVSFWFENDTVKKWESRGLDLSRPYPNPAYNEKAAERYRVTNILANMWIPLILIGIIATGG